MKRMFSQLTYDNDSIDLIGITREKEGNRGFNERKFSWVFHGRKEDELLKICKNGIPISSNQHQEGFLVGFSLKNNIIQKQ